MKYLLLMITCICFLISGTDGQNTATEFKMPTIIHASPNTESIMKYGNLPTNNYTGTANISIPLFEASDGNISIPVSINYNTSGIRVAEEAGRVGLGWNINAGGMISRSIRGYDDFNHRFGDGYRWHNTTGNGPEITTGSKVYDVIMLNAIDHGPGCESTLYPNQNLSGVFGSITAYDLEPDAYQFNFSGYSGKFIMKRNKEVILESKQKLKITCDDNLGTSFTIRTPDGFSYEFRQIETNRDNEFQFVYRKVAWHLTKITSSKGDFINFIYHNQGQTIQYAGSSLNQVRADVLNTDPPGCASNSFNSSFVPASEISSPVLDKITYRNGEIRFIYDNTRLDISGDIHLIRLEKWKDDGISLVQKWNFEYDYFTGTSDEDFVANSQFATNPYKRLKLTKVYQTGLDGSTLPPYEFTYKDNFNAITPAKSSFARDHWGFYNGKGLNTILIPEFTATSIDPIGIMDDKRSVDPYFSSIFTMTSIKYPAGGKTELQYESNDYDIVSTGASGYNEQNTTPPTQVVSVHPATSYNGFISGQQPAIGYSDKLVDLTDMYVDNHPVTGDGKSAVTVDIFYLLRNSPIQCPLLGYGNLDVTFTLLDINGNVIAGPVDMFTNPCTAPTIAGVSYNHTYRLFPNKYYVRFYINPNNPVAANLLSIMTATYTYTVDKTKAVDAAGIVGRDYAGGLRIYKITDYDNANKITNVKKFDYSLVDLTGKKRSSGKRMLPPFYTYEKVNNSTCSNLMLFRASDSYTPLSSSSGSPVCYDKVTVTLGENGEFGKQEFTYSNVADKLIVPKEQGTAVITNALHVGVSSAYYTPLYAVWHNPANGMPLKQIDYEAVWDAANQRYNYNLVKEENNTYINHQLNEESAWYGIQLIPLDGGSQSNCNLFRRVNYPAIIQDRIVPAMRTTKIIDKNDPLKSLTTSVTYQYDANTHLQLLKQETINSKGALLKTEYKYPHDFAGTLPVYDNMINQNIVSAIIEQKNYNNTTLLSQIKSNYNLWNTELIPMPQTVQTAKYANPLETEITYNSYDNKGNPLQYVGKDGVPTSFVWGYKQTYPIAKITGATYAEVLAALGQSDQNLAYLQNLDGTALITELNKIRNNLKISKPLSLVTTFTFAPLIGMVTQTDPNGKILTYEYDVFNRLKLIRDQDGKIIKKVNYVYEFANVQKSATFNRNNCSPGYIGSPVTYTVPAAKYKSVISQADADQQAQNDININGQAYANDPANGYCTAPYSNTVKSGTFIRNNCAVGLTGSSVTYTVLAGTYSSATSQADADQQAQNDVNTNGQAYANTNGTCTSPPSINVQGYNTKTSLYQVKFTNTVTGTNYTFNLTPNTFSLFQLGTVPAGTYNIQFYAWMAASVSATFYVDGLTQFGTTATFSNVSVNSLTIAKMY
jgi:YD repeat-containing protein